MSEKRFEKSVAENKEGSFAGRILKIINAYERKIRIDIAEPGSDSHIALHEERLIDSSKDFEEYAGIRRDICSAFGVPDNPEHIAYFTTKERQGGLVKQRAAEAFYVLIVLDRKPEERAYFIEGRANHQNLLVELVKLAKLDYRAVEEDLGANNPERFLVFKGFIDANKLREGQEQDIFDKDGKIEAPKDWFISGTSLPS